jgi:drug/metabolite transporter (DMT)-like permease
VHEPMSTPRAFIELSLASVFWGFGFIGTVWALGFLSFPAVIFYRFAGAFIFGALFWIYSRPTKTSLFRDFRMSWPLGLWLAVTLILQTWGLLSTSATKSAFITVLYVIIVPVLSSLLDRHKLGWQLWGLLTVALIGTGLIVNVDLSELSTGDLLTFGNAFAAAIHIRRMGANFAQSS